MPQAATKVAVTPGRAPGGGSGAFSGGDSGGSAAAVARFDRLFAAEFDKAAAAGKFAGAAEPLFLALCQGNPEACVLLRGPAGAGEAVRKQIKRFRMHTGNQPSMQQMLDFKWLFLQNYLHGDLGMPDWKSEAQLITGRGAPFTIAPPVAQPPAGRR